jgi:metal-dependent amidase/aminoacylase/carboxypeptidase family protein
VRRIEQAFAWSEDFGHFLARSPGVLFGLGAGRELAALHHPDYDFPDNLIEPGLRIWRDLVNHMLED